MADTSTMTIRATFETRADADIAVEHLVQQHGVPRSDIFIQAADKKNTVGTRPSGGDAGESRLGDAPIKGEIEVSADITSNQYSAVQRSLGDAGALHITSR
ncbi:hypothetical protein GAO09_12010 [Rhizobiales bacterium RZME27]|jgi:hypothetical protein|uniref:Uncharacterized protein n=1 Tax=Endobacterium cereale TaxID=2663029 RepID=A0A6A8A646_9HYPH|nr:hypothetical protein [Endobacterium cereale]MEB2847909.1 hypothetical protein [Endobacterium cereale]MQY46755.1 hypothetical protein [Endobacterium cereale]